MDHITTLEDIAALAETSEIECKLAAGRDGTGQLPTDFWPTYSAFANTRGGVVLLGIKETTQGFELSGLRDPQKVRGDLFNSVNNPQKVSANLLTEEAVRILVIDERKLLSINIPRAGRKDRPVHINGSPMTGTYRRSDTGDRLTDRATVQRMLAEQLEDTRDNRILKGFGPSDLSMGTVLSYRQMLRDGTPAHPFLDGDEFEFLRKVGAFRRDRDTGEDGLTVAGLLMFGLAENIRDEFPNYHLDYQERPRSQTEARWVDRVTLDGTWSGNLFDFYRRIYRKLTADLKVPFSLRDGQRKDETPVHEALREALVNTIVHADYSCRASVLVVKRPDMFGFRNPGQMRMSVSQAIAGGESDGRNRTLQSMFLLVGAGERAGSGVPKIHKGWREQHWKPPTLYDIEEPSEQTRLELRMSDLIPSEAVDVLRSQFGSRFAKLPTNMRLILATAATEGTITHARMHVICDLHPVELSRALQALAGDGFLVRSGRTRGAVYRLAGTPLPAGDTTFGQVAAILAHGAERSETSNLPPKGSESPSKSADLNSEPLGGSGRIVSGLQFALVDAIDKLDAALRIKLTETAAPVRTRGKVSQTTLRATVIEICRGRYMTIKMLSVLLGRDEDYLRQRIVSQMIEEKVLLRAYPASPNHPRQAYIAAEGPPSLQID